jgi:hypothetical protein
MSDYLSLAYHLGCWSETYAQIDPPRLDGVDPEQHELYEAYQEALDALSDHMATLNLPQTRNLVISAIEQIGDLREVQEVIMDSLLEEALSNLELQNETHSSLPIELWHDPERLRSDISSLMPGLVYASLPLIAQQDLVEAGECLANRQPTPAAPLLLRCVEAMLREFHTILTGETSIQKDWNTLEEAIAPRLGSKKMYIIGLLKDIRINHRNPTMHAQIRYDMEEAQRLFHLCTEALTRMNEILSEHNHPEGIA